MSRKEVFPEESELFDFRRGDYRFFNSGLLEGRLAIRDFCSDPDGMPVTYRKFERMEGNGSVPAKASRWLYRHKGKIQLLSIGAGLDETLDFARVCHLPPIIIDPLEPSTIKAGLEELRSTCKLSQPDRQLVDTLLRRVGVYGTNRVRHYQMSLEKALSNEKELLGVADLVLDSWAAKHYKKSDVFYDYQSLLRSDGNKLVWVT